MQGYVGSQPSSLDEDLMFEYSTIVRACAGVWPVNLMKMKFTKSSETTILAAYTPIFFITAPIFFESTIYPLYPISSIRPEIAAIALIPSVYRARQ